MRRRCRSAVLHSFWTRPRLKTTTDEVWIAAHGTTEVDIANTTYDQLPADWQAENATTTTVVLTLIGQSLVSLVDESERTRVGDIIHDAWLARNSWTRGSELDRHFNQLVPEEQAKDIGQMTIARQVLFGQARDLYR